MGVKKFFKSVGIGFLCGMVGLFLSGSFDIFSLLFVIITYLELRRGQLPPSKDGGLQVNHNARKGS